MFEKVLPEIIDAITEFQPELVLIDGPAGAGKTTLAQLLQSETSLTLHLDDFYSGWDENFDSAFLNRINSAHMAHATSAMETKYLRFNWNSQEFEKVESHQKSNLIFIEGVGSFRYQPDDFKILKIFVTTDFLSGLNRVVQRDGEASAPFIALWKQREFELFGSYDLPAEADFYLTT